MCFIWQLLRSAEGGAGGRKMQDASAAGQSQPGLASFAARRANETASAWLSEPRERALRRAWLGCFYFLCTAERGEGPCLLLALAALRIPSRRDGFIAPVLMVVGM